MSDKSFKTIKGHRIFPSLKEAVDYGVVNHSGKTCMAVFVSDFKRFKNTKTGIEFSTGEGVWSEFCRMGLDDMNDSEYIVVVK